MTADVAEHRAACPKATEPGAECWCAMFASRELLDAARRRDRAEACGYCGVRADRHDLRHPFEPAAPGTRARRSDVWEAIEAARPFYAGGKIADGDDEAWEALARIFAAEAEAASDHDLDASIKPHGTAADVAQLAGVLRRARRALHDERCPTPASCPICVLELSDAARESLRFDVLDEAIADEVVRLVPMVSLLAPVESLIASVNVLRARTVDEGAAHASPRIDEAIELVIDTADHYFTGTTMERAVLPPGWIDTADGPRRRDRVAPPASEDAPQ